MGEIRYPTATEIAKMAAGPRYGTPYQQAVASAIEPAGYAGYTPAVSIGSPGQETVDVVRGPAYPIPEGVAMSAGAETDGVATLGDLDGVGILGEQEIYPETAVAIPTALPIVGAVAAVMSLGVFRALLAKFGPFLLKIMVGSAAFAGFMKLLGVGADDSIVLPIKPGEKKRKRYSIGANPRVRTLQRVSRHCMRMLKRHRKVIDEFLPSKRKALPATALARTYLSTAERKALGA